MPIKLFAPKLYTSLCNPMRYFNSCYGVNLGEKPGQPVAVYIKTIILLLLFFLICPPSTPGMEIIVHKSVPETEYTVNELRSIFAMQQHVWPNGKKIHVFVLSDDDSMHRKFTKTKLNMFPHQFRRIWDRLIFSGTGHGPRQVGSMEEMIKKIMVTPNSIGYADCEPINDKIRFLK